MRSRKNKLYALLFVICTIGYVWLYYNIGSTTNADSHSSLAICPLKNITGLPCPSCGSTRAAVALLHGEVIKAVYLNPLGIITVIAMVLIPIWMLFDIATKRSSLFIFYEKGQQILRQPKFAIPAIVLVLINWIWNFTKGL